MQSKRSTDFGLYKYEKTKFWSLKCVAVLSAGAIIFTLVVYLAFKYSEVKEELPTIEHATEKLVILEHESDHKVQNQGYPKPFGVVFRGIKPTSFSTPTGNNPKISRLPDQSSPRNIQDVISYLTEQNYKHQGINYGGTTDTNISPSSHLVTTQHFPQYAPKSPLLNHDPFYYYKPQDPGDVNLLATGSLRFAPPIWRSFKSPQQTTNNYESYKRPKSLILNLNIYPSSVPRSYGRDRYRKDVDVGDFVGSKPMVVRLNIYPEGNHLEQAEEMKRRLGI